MEKCEKHPTYKAMRAPTSGCEECWRIYLGEEPEESVIQISSRKKTLLESEEAPEPA